MTPSERRLAAALSRRGLELRRMIQLPGHGHVRTFRLELSRGRQAKMRVYPTGRAAARVEQCLLAPVGLTLPRPLARVGRRLVVEYVAGTTLERQLTGRASATSRWAAATGRLLARLHGTRVPAVRASPLGVYTRLMTLTLSRLVERGALGRTAADALRALPPPAQQRLAITHGDACPENLVVTRAGRLRAIDEERVAVRPVGFDLARTICRWPLPPDEERRLLRAYRRAGGAAAGFAEARGFWLASALTSSAAYRLRHRPGAIRPVAAMLARLATAGSPIPPRRR